MNIPEVISNFNVYGGDNSKLIGVSGEVTLPDLSAVTYPAAETVTWSASDSGSYASVNSSTGKVTAGPVKLKPLTPWDQA